MFWSWQSNLWSVAAVKVPKYKHLPKFPGTSRDIAVVVPLEVSMRELEGVIRANAGELLTDAKVFDVYTVNR